jgi:hypothetical protein
MKKVNNRGNQIIQPHFAFFSFFLPLFAPVRRYRRLVRFFVCSYVLLLLLVVAVLGGCCTSVQSTTPQESKNSFPSHPSFLLPQPNPVSPHNPLTKLAG